MKSFSQLNVWNPMYRHTHNIITLDFMNIFLLHWDLDRLICIISSVSLANTVSNLRYMNPFGSSLKFI